MQQRYDVGYLGTWGNKGCKESFNSIFQEQFSKYTLTVGFCNLGSEAITSLKPLIKIHMWTIQL